MSEIELLTVGRNVVDLYAEQLRTPLRQVESFRKSVGGTATNVAVAAARLGHRAALLTRVQDPRPASEGGRLAPQAGANAAQRGDPALDTAEWGDGPGRPGNMRVDMVLPSPDLVVLDAGVFWPAPGDPMAKVARTASRHRLVWVDLALD